MAKFSLRRYDTQARVSVGMSVAAAAVFFVQAFVTLRRTDFSELVILYSKNRLMAIYAATALTLCLAISGFGLGLNSLGQRRNDQQKLSWIGFLISAVVLALSVGLFIILKVRGDLIVTK